jgi:acetyl esterase/lipase
MSRDILDLPAPLADWRLKYGPDTLHVGGLRLPQGPGPHPVVIVIHGGFWRARRDRQYMGHLASALTAEGFATWNIEYRRIGDSDGGWPGTFHDTGLAADHLRSLAREYALDLSRVISLGHSAGGHLALWLAARPRIPDDDPLYSASPLSLAGAVSLAGVADLCTAWDLALSEQVVETFLGGSPYTVPERYATASPFELLPLGVPQVLVHGTIDDDVPYSISLRYTEAARTRGDDARLATLEGMDHFALVDPHSPAWPTVLDAVRSLLG